MIITLSGSVRFMEAFMDWNRILTMAGHTVLSLSGQGSQDARLQDEDKEIADLVYFQKILLSDALVVLNVDDYTGYSTNREVLWARLNGKKIYWLIPRKITGDFNVWAIGNVRGGPLCSFEDQEKYRVTR